jgi:hypothetical protein
VGTFISIFKSSFLARLVSLEGSVFGLEALDRGFNSHQNELYSKLIRFVLGTAGFLLSYFLSLSDFKTIRPPFLHFLLSELFFFLSQMDLNEHPIILVSRCTNGNKWRTLVSVSPFIRKN